LQLPRIVEPFNLVAPFVCGFLLYLFLEVIAKFTFSTWLSFLRKQESLSFNRLNTPAFAGVTKNGNFAIGSLVILFSLYNFATRCIGGIVIEVSEKNEK